MKATNSGCSSQTRKKIIQRVLAVNQRVRGSSPRGGA